MPINRSAQSFRGPWEGDTKLVMGIDIGSTYSGVAFTFLQNGENQTIHRVPRWPGQSAQSQQGRVPTLIWYDRHAKAMAFGAEALSCIIEEEAEDKDWVLAKNFRLHLHPSDMALSHELNLDALPPGVTLLQIYSDFLGYLLKHTRAYFEDRILDGKVIWERYSPAMEVVIAHPNGWGIREQAFLRSAAVAAGFSAIEQASRKVRFVTEAEARIHFCMHHTNLGNRLQPGMNFAVCDAGDSTVETTLYSVISMRPTLKFEEKRASVCVQAGSTFVDFEVERFLRKTLESIGLPTKQVADYTRAGVKEFGSFAKRAFEDEMSTYSICFAPSSFNNVAINTRRGRMRIPGSTIKTFFDVCVNQITESVDQQLDFNARRSNTSYIILTGEFGDSTYLRQELKRRYEPRGCQLVVPYDSTSKAVADGAVIWKVACGPSDCALRFSWGLETSVIVDHNDPDFQDGRGTIMTPAGWKVVPGRWKGFATKGAIPDRNATVRIPFTLDFPSLSAELGSFELSIYSYSGDEEPVWMKNKQGELLAKFRNAATIQATLGSLRGALERSISLEGSLQWQLNFNACMRFGEAELEAYLEWQENGVIRAGPRTLISLFDEA